MAVADPLAALLAETDETAANLRDQLGGWTLPPGQSAVVLAPGGHLSIVHTAALEGWARQVEQLRAALVASRETAARLNRRCQRAEAIADRCVAGRPMTGRALGRALANYAASRLADVAREALEEWADSLPYVDSYFAEKYGYAETMARLRARLDVLTGGGERATVGDMASPHGPPPTKSLPSLLDGLISQAQEIARLHPKALHAAAIVALAEASRRECDGDGDEPPAP